MSPRSPHRTIAAALGTVVAATALSVTTGGPAAAWDCYPNGVKYLVTEKAGVYSGYRDGQFVGLIKWKDAGSVVVGAPTSESNRIIVRLGDGGTGLMPSRKVSFIGCA